MDMKVGYIGLGALGSELARRFVAEHELRVWDLNVAATSQFEKIGVRVAPSAAQLARECDVILLCLPRSSDVRQLIFAPGGLAEGLSAGKLVIDQTSGIPRETKDMAQQLALRGVAMIDAAVSASPHVVAQGTATIMTAGPDDVYERALPVLRAITETIYRCGTRVGDGQAMKMVNNAMNAGCRLGTLEVVALGRKAGLSLECMTDVLNKGGGRNQTTEKMLPAIAQGKSSTNFALSLMLKDVNQAVTLGMETGVPLLVTGVVRGLLQMGANTLGPDARLEDMIGLIESMNAARFAQPGKEAAPQGVQAGGRSAGKRRVGHVGLGGKGGALARRLMESSTIHVHDADQDLMRKFEAAGAIAVPDLSSLSRACDVIMLCPPASASVSDVLFAEGGLAGGLSAGTVVIDQTRGDPEETRRCAAKLQALGVSMVDAPSSNGSRGAASGTSVIMAGGEPQAFAEVQSFLRALSPHVIYCGEVGNGRIANLISNAVSSLCRLVSYECVAAGFKHGLTLRDMAEVLDRSSGWSTAAREVLSGLVSGQQSSDFEIETLVDDLRLATSLSMSCGATLLISNAARSLFEVAANELGGTTNIDEMARLYEAMSGTHFEPARTSGFAV
jgi:3-hydroxyisobutyrate dehydrogenase